MSKAVLEPVTAAVLAEMPEARAPFGRCGEPRCAAINREAGLLARTTVLAIIEFFTHYGVQRFGLVTLYGDGVQQSIVANDRAGFGEWLLDGPQLS